MVNGERSTGGASLEVEPDGPVEPVEPVEPVDVEAGLGGLTERARRLGLRRPRRLGLRRPRRQPTEEQLVLFEMEGDRRHRPGWWRDFPMGGPAEDTTSTASVVADPRARLLLLAAVLGYVALFVHWSLRRQDGLGTGAFDLGVFDQGVWLLSRFKTPFVTVNGRNLFGDHTSFILLPWALVYRVMPTAKTLLVGQTLALGLGAWPTFLIARDKLRSEMLGAFLGVAYLLHPVVGWTNLSENFHPDAFEIPLVLFGVWFLLRHRWLGYWLCVIALLLVKEDVAFLTIALGVYVALRHDRRMGWITCGVSAAYLLAAFWVIIPAFLGGGTVYTGRIPFGGPGGFIKESATHPGTVISYITTRPRVWYLWQLTAPFGFLAWWSPSILLIAIGPLALNVVSNFGYQYDVRYHYSTLIFPILMVATIFGLASAPRRRHRALVAVVLVASTWCAYLWSPMPFGRSHPSIADPRSTTVASFRRAQRLIPKNAVVSSYYGYIPQIDHRTEIYMFPNPWVASYWGTFKQEGKRLPQADRVQFIILPTNLDPKSTAVLNGLRTQFTTVYDRAGVQLLHRNM
jgi:uncharacterized membrane protein